jgi:hypothetical protein
MKNHDHLLEFAKKELALINFDQSNIHDTILKFLEQSSKICNNNTDDMKQIANFLIRLIDRLPLSPINEIDFYDEPYPVVSDQLMPVKRCTRYPHIYQMSDGKYYDDRAVAFRFLDSNQNDKIYMYGAGYNSKKEITLPHYPNEEIVILPDDYANMDSTNRNINYDALEPDYEVE